MCVACVLLICLCFEVLVSGLHNRGHTLPCAVPPWGASTVNDVDGNAADTAAQTLRVVVAAVAGVLVVAAVVAVATVTGSGGG